MPLAHLASILALPALALLAAPAAAVPPPASVPAAAASAGAAAVDPLAHAPVVDRLDNGLTLVTVPFDAPGIVSYYTLVKAGSRDEVEPGKSGYAHLFEHLMFRGTDTMSASDYEARMQAMGADNNAWTSNDLTVYVPTIPKEGLAELISIEADRFQHLHVAEDKYKDETGAVLGEYNKAFANPARVMDEALRTLAFRSHTYGHTTIGTRHDVEDMPNQYEYSRQFFRRFYTPDDCVIVAVGDVDRGKVLEMVKAAYGGWQGKRAVTAVKPEPEQTAPRQRAMTWRGATEPRLREGFRIPATGSSLRDAAALSTVAAIAFDESSDLYQRLVVKEQKLISLRADPEDVLSRDPSLFLVNAKLKTGTSFDEIVAAIDDTLARVARGQTPSARLDAVRSFLLNKTTLGLKTTGAVATNIAAFTAITGDVGGFQAYVRELSQVTAEDVARVAKLLVPKNRSVVTMVAAGPAAAPAPKVAPPPPPRPMNPAPPPAAKGGAK